MGKLFRRRLPDNPWADTTTKSIFASMANVSKQDRLVDVAALAGILVGVALYLLANYRLHELAKLSFQHPGPRWQSALQAADHARYLAYGGVALIVAGCAIAVTGAVRVARRR